MAEKRFLFQPAADQLDVPVVTSVRVCRAIMSS